MNPNPYPESENYDPAQAEILNADVQEIEERNERYLKKLYDYKVGLEWDLKNKYTEARQKSLEHEMEFVRYELENLAECDNECVRKCTTPTFEHQADLERCLNTCECKFTAVEFEFEETEIPSTDPSSFLQSKNDAVSFGIAKT